MAQELDENMKRLQAVFTQIRDKQLASSIGYQFDKDTIS